MAVVPMQKLRLYVHREYASEVLRAIQKVGVVHFEQVTVGDDELTAREKEAFEFNYASSRLDFAVRFLSRFATPATGLRAMVEGTKVRTTGTALYDTVNAFDYNTVIEAAQDIERSIVEAEQRIDELEAERALLTVWQGLDRPLVAERQTRFTEALFVAAPNEGAIEAVRTVCGEAGILTYELVADPTHHLFVLLKRDREAFERILAEHKCSPVDLPLRRGTPHEELERIGRALVSQREEIERAEGRARELVKELDKLKIVSDYMLWQKEKHDLLTSARASMETVVFEGWCPKADRVRLEERIENKTRHYALEEVVPTDGELPPVEIRNHPFIRPFESITRLYGLPGHTDLDPTAYLAGFFFLFFGLALTDVGYGLIMALGLGFILWRYRVPKDLKPMLWLMFAGGIATVFAGMFFGGYFGVSMDIMPAWLQAIQLFDPMKNPMPVFYLALALGVVQITTGLILYIVSEARNGRLVTGLLEKGPWVGVFVCGSLWLGAYLSYIPGAPTVYEYLVYACLATIVLYATYAEENVLLKPVKGVLSLYDIVAYFSDILSYSRLLALGLATSAVAYAVNLIAAMVQGAPFYLGYLFMAIILIVGHLFNMALNILGAFIHSARLQFVEFFGKFISGSGRLYVPFKRQERYVELIES
jgi:V/A-type H+-transporting ATPase subunit I